MIVDIPSSQDFEDAGIAYLNIAWEKTLGLGDHDNPAELALPPGPEDDVDDHDASDEAVRIKYQRKFDRALAPFVARDLAIALSLAHQGTEFLLKGRIARVSPYLLLTGSSRDWPKRCETRNVPFSEFQTLDAQDLVRTHDAVSHDRLPPQFKQVFSAMRQTRNIVSHTVDKNLLLTARRIIASILDVSETLFGPRKWISIRRAYLEAEPDPSFTVNALLSELNDLVNILPRAGLNRHFGFAKGQRRYICGRCESSQNSDWYVEDAGLAQLDPNSPESTQVYCIVCQKHYAVFRRKCTEKDCKRNVIDAERNVCLSCLTDQTGTSGGRVICRE